MMLFIVVAIIALTFARGDSVVGSLRGKKDESSIGLKSNSDKPDPATTKAGVMCPALPVLDQVPSYGYVSMGATSSNGFCESPFYFPYKCTGWMTAATEKTYKLAEPTFAIAEHYVEWQDDKKGSLYAALKNDLSSELANNAIVKFVDALAFKSECIVINKHRKGSALDCKKQCYEPGNWGNNQIVYFSYYNRGTTIRMNFYVRSSINSVAITTKSAISTVSGFKTALTYVYQNQATDLQKIAYEAALQFAPQSSQFVNLLAGYPGTKPTCSFFDVSCHILGAPKPTKAKASAFKIKGAGVTDVASSSS